MCLKITRAGHNVQPWILAHMKWFLWEGEWKPQQVIGIGRIGTCMVNLMVQLHRQVFSIFLILLFPLFLLLFFTIHLTFFFHLVFCLPFWLFACLHLCDLSCPKVIYSAVETTERCIFWVPVDCIHFGSTAGMPLDLYGQISYWCGCESKGLLWTGERFRDTGQRKV